MAGSWCNKCERVLTVKDFYTRKKGKGAGSLIKPCKECIRNQQKEYTKSPVGKRVHKQTNLRAKYNLTLKQHKQMYIDQDGCCLSCNETIPYSKIVVDHDHNTGKVRGLLCIFCNTLAGYVEKHPRRIEQVKSYLRK